MTMAASLDPTAGFPALCFGKLPGFADFVRHNAGGRDVLAFDRWLQQGLFHARAELRDEWPRAFREATPYHFVFFPESAESFLVGVLQPSRDRGEREYPFVVAQRVDRRFPAALLPLAPVLFAPFLDAAARLIREATAGMSAAAIVEATERLPDAVLHRAEAAVRAYAAHLTATRTAEVAEGLWGADGDARLARALRAMLDVLLPLRGRNAARLAPGLRFPLPPDIPGLHVVCSFWLDATALLTGASSPRPFLFWTPPGAAERAHLFVFLREPSPRSVLQLLRPDRPADAIHPIDDGLADDAPARALPSPLAGALAPRDATLRQLLDARAGPRLRAPSLR